MIPPLSRARIFTRCVATSFGARLILRRRAKLRRTTWLRSPWARRRSHALEAPADVAAVDRDAVAGQAKRVRHRCITVGRRPVILEFGEDREFAGWGRQTVGPVENHCSTDLMPRPEHGQDWRSEIHPHPDGSRRHAVVVPHEIAVVMRPGTSSRDLIGRSISPAAYAWLSCSGESRTRPSVGGDGAAAAARTVGFG